VISALPPDWRARAAIKRKAPRLDRHARRRPPAVAAPALPRAPTHRGALVAER
jgi:hypothetical protein